MTWRLARHKITAATVAVAVLVVACADTPALEDPDAICPLFGEAREARGGDDRETTQEAVARLLTVLPEEYHDEIALWYYPVGGSVDGLDTSGVAAEEAGELLEALYRANC